MDGTSEKQDPEDTGFFSAEMTSPFNTTSYWGPSGCTNIVKKLTEENKNTQWNCPIFSSFDDYFLHASFVRHTEDPVTVPPLQTRFPRKTRKEAIMASRKDRRRSQCYRNRTSEELGRPEEGLPQWVSPGKPRARIPDTWSAGVQPDSWLLPQRMSGRPSTLGYCAAQASGRAAEVLDCSTLWARFIQASSNANSTGALTTV